MIPAGYRLYEEHEYYVKIAVVDFALMGQKCPEEIEHEGKKYTRGMMDAIPPHLAGSMCSMRIYNLVA